MQIAPSETPWGYAQTKRQQAPGIWFVSTASHGGVWLAPDRQAEMPEALKQFKPWGESSPGSPWYEEDCDWAIVALAFPGAFSESEIAAAWRTVETYQEAQPAFTAFKATPNGQAVAQIVAGYLARAKELFRLGSHGTILGGGWYGILVNEADHNRMVEFRDPQSKHYDLPPTFSLAQAASAGLILTPLRPR